MINTLPTRLLLSLWEAMFYTGYLCDVAMFPGLAEQAKAELKILLRKTVEEEKEWLKSCPCVGHVLIITPAVNEVRMLSKGVIRDSDRVDVSFAAWKMCLDRTRALEHVMDTTLSNLEQEMSEQMSRQADLCTLFAEWREWKATRE